MLFLATARMSLSSVATALAWCALARCETVRHAPSTAKTPRGDLTTTALSESEVRIHRPSPSRDWTLAIWAG
jgi:hypothetical protein